MSKSSISIKRIRQDSDEIRQEKPIFKRLLTVATPQEPMAQLYSINDSNPHEIIPYQKTVIIGRSKECDIVIKGPDISQKHAKLTVFNDGNTGLIFLNIIDTSSNGTFLNNEKLSNETKLLNDGDRITFAKSGGYIFRYNRNLNEEDKENIRGSGMNSSSLFRDDYILGKELGSGHYAVVNEAVNKRTGIKYAVKIFKPQHINDVKNTKKLNQELEVLKSLEHKNIVKLIDRYVEPINTVTTSTYLILEKVNGGELFTRIINKRSLTEQETKAIFTQLITGLKYLHDRGVVHRDIKPENVLLDINLRTSPDQIQTGPWNEDEIDVTVKIADFGLAKFVGPMKFTNTLCGTPAYVAPEVFTKERNYTSKVDVWSAGVLLYVCLVGFPPFSDDLGPPDMRTQITNCIYAFYSPFFDHIKDPALDLITKMLVKDPDQRYNVDQVLSHPWMTSVNNPLDENAVEVPSVTNRHSSDILMVERSPAKSKMPKTYSELYQ